MDKTTLISGLMMSTSNGSQRVVSYVNNSEMIQFPEPTKWKYSRKCCFFWDLYRILPTSKSYCNYWETNFCMPCFVIFLIVMVLLTFFMVTITSLTSTLKIVSIIEICIPMVLFMYSYYGAMCMDPGFLPYDWVRTKKTKYSPLELLEGTAIRPDQLNFASKNGCPFASFSTASGRFVIRGDHICGWISNWVGKRNHKQFILMCLYGGILSTSLFAWKLVKPSFIKGKEPFVILVVLTSGMLEIIFSLIFFWMFFVNIYELSRNQTQITIYKKTETEKLSFMDSMRLIFGGSTICCWFCPTPAFGDDLIGLPLT